MTSKHPPPSKLNPDAFYMHCGLLPPLVNIDVTAAHVEQVHAIVEVQLDLVELMTFNGNGLFLKDMESRAII